MKLLKSLIVSAAVFACAVTTTMALPSAGAGGTVVETPTFDGEVIEGATVKFEDGLTTVKDEEAKEMIKKLNSGTKVEEVLKDVEIALPAGKTLADLKLLTGFQDLVARDAEGNIIANAKNVKVKWTVPNLTANAGDVYVLHYSNTRNVWEVITPDAVDYAAGTIQATFPDLSPVAVVYVPSSDNGGNVTPDTGDATNIALYAGVGIAALAVVAVVVYRNKKFN